MGLFFLWDGKVLFTSSNDKKFLFSFFFFGVKLCPKRLSKYMIVCSLSFG